MDTILVFAAVASPAETTVTGWEPLGTLALKLSVVLFLVLLNGFFVASEFAIVKVRASQLDAFATQNDRRVRAARTIIEHLDAYLSATQIGVTLASLALGWVGEPFLARILAPVFALIHVAPPALIQTVSFVPGFHPDYHPAHRSR